MPDVQQQIADALTRSNSTVAVAESLTGGSISAALSAIEGASQWFLGAVVAYGEKVKFELLGVEPGPVINARTSERMAIGVGELLGSDFALATTGVGGPGPQEDVPQGTVYIALVTPSGGDVTEYRFDGDPSEIVEKATRTALELLATAVEAVPARR